MGDSELRKALDRGFTPENGLLSKLDSVEEPMRSVLVTYSGIPPEELVAHVTKVRDRAFAIFPYPCIGLFLFLQIGIRHSPRYSEILDRVKGGAKVLDVGCGFGQDLRQLVSDGAPSENLYGVDLYPEFLSLGYELFQDAGKFKGHLSSADIFDDTSEVFQSLHGQIDVINAAFFIHLFQWKEQVRVMRRLIGLLRPGSGSMLVGQNSAHINTDAHPEVSSIVPFHHTTETWNRLCTDVRDEGDVEFGVEVCEVPYPGSSTEDMPADGPFLLRFAIILE